MSETPECTCDLVDVSVPPEIRFVRGFSRGCVVHLPTEWEKRLMRDKAEHDARVAAAMQAAREAP